MCTFDVIGNDFKGRNRPCTTLIGQKDRPGKLLTIRLLCTLLRPLWCLYQLGLPWLFGEGWTPLSSLQSMLQVQFLLQDLLVLWTGA